MAFSAGQLCIDSRQQSNIACHQQSDFIVDLRCLDMLNLHDIYPDLILPDAEGCAGVIETKVALQGKNASIIV